MQQLYYLSASKSIYYKIVSKQYYNFNKIVNIITRLTRRITKSFTLNTKDTTKL